MLSLVALLLLYVHTQTLMQLKAVEAEVLELQETINNVNYNFEMAESQRAKLEKLFKDEVAVSTS
jgi:hypothetical protein